MPDQALKRLARLVFLSLLAVLPPTVATSQTTVERLTYRSDARLSKLKPSTEEVAVRFRSGADADAVMARLGLTKLGPLTDGMVLARGHVAEASLSKDPGVEFFTPTYSMGGSTSIPSNSLLVAFEKTATPGDIAKALAPFRFEDTTALVGDERTLLCALPYARAVELFGVIAALAAAPGVNYAEANLTHLIRLSSCNGHPEMYGDYWDQQWHLRKLKAQNAWCAISNSPAATNPPIEVAVLDTGFDYSHEDLLGVMMQGPANGGDAYDFYDGDEDPSPPVGSCNEDPGVDAHGTAVAGILGAVFHAAGVADCIRIMPLRVLGPGPVGGSGLTMDARVANAINWAVSHGARVLSMSFGIPEAEAVKTALTTAINTPNKCVVVAAVGNECQAEQVDFPARHTGVIGVGAVDYLDDRAEFSNFSGTLGDVDLVAPGVNVFTLDATGGCGYNNGNDGSNPNYTASFGGTSAATPMVAAVAAMILRVSPALSPAAVTNILKNPSNTDPATGGLHNNSDLSLQYRVGAGRVNAYKAVASALEIAPHTSNHVVTLNPLKQTYAEGEQVFITWSGSCSNCASEDPQRVYLVKEGGEIIGEIGSIPYPSGGTVSWTVACPPGGSSECQGDVAARIMVERSHSCFAFQSSTGPLTIQFSTPPPPPPPSSPYCWHAHNAQQESPVVAGDDIGSFFLAWQNNSETRLGHVSPGGVMEWEDGSGYPGKAIWSSNLAPARPIMVSDGHDGVLVAHEGSVKRYIRTTTVGQWGGALPWTPTGKYPRLAADAAGNGYVVAQIDGTPNPLAVAQLDAAYGDVVWLRTISNAPSNLRPVRITHHAGETFVLYRNEGNTKLWVQKFGPTGLPHWPSGGTLVRTTTEIDEAARCVADGTGGCYVLWGERAGANWHAQLQRLDASGQGLWGSNGETLDGFASDWGVYPGILYLARCEDGDLLTCWSRPEGTDNYMFRARRSNGSATSYEAVWDGSFTFNKQNCSSCGTDIAVSPLDEFEGVSVVYPEEYETHTDFRMYGRYITREGVLTARKQLSEYTFTNDNPGPATYANRGSVLGAWGVHFPHGDNKDLCGRTISTKNLTDFTQIGGRVTAPDCRGPFTVDVTDAAGDTVLASAVTDVTGDYVVRVSTSQAEAGIRVRVRLEDGTMASSPADYESSSPFWLSGWDFALSYAPITAGWGTSPVSVTATSCGATIHRAVRAGDGSLFVAWAENRGGAGERVYAQKFNNAGVPQWSVNGVAVSTLAAQQLDPDVVDDGSGGAFVAFTNRFGGGVGDIVGQHLSASGSSLWGAGLTICNQGDDQDGVRLVSDGGGGLVAAWSDRRAGFEDVYAQRVLSNGTLAWASNGIAICSASGSQDNLAISGDGSGGAIIAWEDSRGIEAIYAQRVTSSGVPSWAANGIPLAQSAGAQTSPKVAPDGGTGAFVIWTDFSPTPGLVAQHLLSNGTLQWSSSGAVVAAGSNHRSPKLCADGAAGGVIAVWENGAYGAERVNAQRLDANGIRLWLSAGLAVAAGSGRQWQPTVSSNPAGGAFVAWTDERSGNKDVYAQRLSTGGSLSWGAGGMVVEALAGSQSEPVLVTRTGGAAHVVWKRAEPADLYATLVQNPPPPGGGCTKNCPTESALVPTDIQNGIFAIQPNPFRNGAEVHFAVDRAVEPRIGVFDVQGRQILEVELAEHTRGAWRWSWDGRGADGNRAQAGIYFVRIRLGTEAHTRRIIKLDP